MDDLQITKKAERYVAEMSTVVDTGRYVGAFHEPEMGRFDGALYLIVAENDRVAIATSIERLIDVLDAMSLDPDLEDGADDEPSIAGDDCERDDCDDEDSGDSEPMMGAGERHPTSRESPWGRCGELTVMRYGSNSQEDWAGERATAPSQDECEAENEHGGDVLDEPHDGRDDDEYELGWTEHVDQRLAGKVEQNTWNHPEGEPELGWSGIATGWRGNDAVDDREGDDEREFDHGDYDGPGFISGGLGL